MIDLSQKSGESKLIIHGGVPLNGTVEADSAKNSVLLLMIAACLTRGEEVNLKKIPRITDVVVLHDIIKELGMDIDYTNENMTIKGSIKNHEVPKNLGSKIRASIVLLGALLTTVGEAVLPLPGGDKIGDRPVDIHLDCLSAFGVDIETREGVIYAKARELPLKGTEIFMRFPSVLATSNLIIAAVLASGQTVIQNVAREPEIVDLAVMLSRMGVRISGVGTSTIVIHGVDKLRGVEYVPIPDRIEVGTLLICLAISGGSGTIKGMIPEHNKALLSMLKNSGAEFEVLNDEIHFHKSEFTKPIKAIAMPYPGLATDLQPIITSFATQCQGESVICDTIFLERFSHVSELQKLGANIYRTGNNVRVIGKSELFGTAIEGNDIRSVTSLICAALVAKGVTQIGGISHLLRGHMSLIEKLKQLNASIE